MVGKAKIDELREYYDTHDTSEDLEGAAYDDTIVKAPMVGITVRFPKPALDRVRAIANARNVKVTALIRDLVEQAIADEQADMVISVADVRRLIAERSKPAA